MKTSTGLLINLAGALIFAVVPAAPPLARAEGKWVLWLPTERPGRLPSNRLPGVAPGLPLSVFPWEARGVFDTEADCEAERNTRLESVVDNRVTPSAIPTLKCLPDTVDPRDPKAK
jgi:hypothetical protein